MIEVPDRFVYAKKIIPKFLENPLGYLGYTQIDQVYKNDSSNRIIYVHMALELRRIAILGYLSALKDVGLIDSGYLKNCEEYLCSSAAIKEDLDIIKAIAETTK